MAEYEDVAALALHRAKMPISEYIGQPEFVHPAKAFMRLLAITAICLSPVFIAFIVYLFIKF